MQALTVRPLEAQHFAPFGDVIEVSDRAERRMINEGSAQRYHDLARLDLLQEGGRPIVSLFRATPLALPITIKMMERHPKSSQAFIPLSPHSYLVVVAPPGALDAGMIEAFAARPDQGVNYAPGVWHHYLLALGAVSDFLVIDRDGPGENLDEVHLAAADQRLVRIL